MDVSKMPARVDLVGLIIITIFVLIYYSFCFPLIALSQISQRNGKSLKTGILHILSFASKLLCQFYFRLARWVNPMNTSGVVCPSPETTAHVFSITVV